MDQPPGYCRKEALGTDPGEVHRCWRCWCCCLHCRTAAPNRASIAINYLRYYYNYLFLYWDCDRAGSALTVRWKPPPTTSVEEDGRNYCYYYYCCCWWAGDVVADGDFRARALGDARRAEVPLNAAPGPVPVVPAAAGERAAAAVEEVDAAGGRRPGAVEVGPDLERRVVAGLSCCRCCLCWG